ncbi:MAG: flavodoxin-dependent (E)-4-hydroxy-3-methylbut-2-enyl-diphosphate synthase [Kiritimatiellaeota bacterium]|nr:flavodoxin-dependent (E)-4-hydroxy-3-methylbut-2-enyl-diphosphate synthase [Kiritimatiellota bacterium]
MTRRSLIGNVPVGGGAPVSVQSMTNTHTDDPAATLAQLRRLAAAGCDVARLAVPDTKALAALPDIIKESPIPLVADIHFDHRLALGAISAGIQAVRINPGNIDSEKKIEEVAKAAGEADVPIRVGANSGSLPANLAKKARASNEAMAIALVEAAEKQCALFERFGFKNLKVSLKSSRVPAMILANRIFSEKHDHPLHLGVTEAGTIKRGIIKSAIGIGALLADDIGDTIRVSLTADPVEEVTAGIAILESLGLRTPNPEIISCPTCGRTEIDLMELAERLEREIERMKERGEKVAAAKIAVMGCVVNGPGEAADADIGIAGSKNGKATLFKHGETIGVFPQEEAFQRLLSEIRGK